MKYEQNRSAPGLGRFVLGVAGDTPIDAQSRFVFQAAFACTVSLIIANALTERASKLTNVLCAIFAGGVGYLVLAGLVWGQEGIRREIGFVDTSGASAVHLLGASASPFAVERRWRTLPYVRLARLQQR